MVVEVFDATFEHEVLRSETPVLLDLYADWCAPCKKIAPILSELSAELSDHIKFVKVDVEKNAGIAQAFQVRSIPWLLLFVEGRPVDEIRGAADKERILAMLKPLLPKAAAEIEVAELAELMRQRRAVPVDIRDAGSFSRYRIPGAIHAEAPKLESNPNSVAPSDGRLRVLYGRSTDEAKDLAAKLREQGIDVGYLKGGFLYWEADGLDVERP